MANDGSIQPPKERMEQERNEDYYEIIQHIVDTQYKITREHKRVLDEKAQNIFIFSGIMASIYIGIATLFFRDKLPYKIIAIDLYDVVSIYSSIVSLFFRDELSSKFITINLYDIIAVLFAVGFLLVILSIVYSPRAYDLKEWNVPAKPDEMISAINNVTDINKILKNLSLITCEAIKNNDETCEKRVKKLEHAFKFLVAGIIICTLISIVMWFSL